MFKTLKNVCYLSSLACNIYKIFKLATEVKNERLNEVSNEPHISFFLKS